MKGTGHEHENEFFFKKNYVPLTCTGEAPYLRIFATGQKKRGPC